MQLNQHNRSGDEFESVDPAQRLGTVDLLENDLLLLRLPRFDAKGEVFFCERKVTAAEWQDAVKSRLELLPTLVGTIVTRLAERGVTPDMYKLYLYGSLARGQCTESSDIDFAICDANRNPGDLLSPTLRDAVYYLDVSDLTDLQVSLGRPPDHFEKGCYVRLL